jgi:LysM domain
VASLSAHLTAGAEHGRLGFHPLCTRCRDERLAGNLDSELLVSRRTQAVLAAGVLAFSTATPAVSVAAEPDQEQEGGTTPTPDGGSGGTVDDPAFDPGGADTPLDVETGAPSGSPEAGGDLDDGTEPTPVEREEPDDPDGRLVLGESPAEAAPTGGEPAPSSPPPPEHDPTAHPPQPPVPAPESVPVSGHLVETTDRGDERAQRIVSVAPAHETEGSDEAASVLAPPTAPEATDDGALDASPAIAVETVRVSQSVATSMAVEGKRYTVRDGDSLWSIAQRLLGGDASNRQIAREVSRLWRLNEERIGTGDPSLLRIGTVLKLR